MDRNQVKLHPRMKPFEEERRSFAQEIEESAQGLYEVHTAAMAGPNSKKILEQQRAELDSIVAPVLRDVLRRARASAPKRASGSRSVLVLNGGEEGTSESRAQWAGCSVSSFAAELERELRGESGESGVDDRAKKPVEPSFSVPLAEMLGLKPSSS